MTGTMVALLYLFKLPGLFYLLYLSGVLPLAAAQYMLNRFWETIEDPALSIRQAFSVGELAALIVGSLFLGLVVTGIVNQH
jgi:hypothetical protein